MRKDRKAFVNDKLIRKRYDELYFVTNFYLSWVRYKKRKKGKRETHCEVEISLEMILGSVEINAFKEASNTIFVCNFEIAGILPLVNT